MEEKKESDKVKSNVEMSHPLPNQFIVPIPPVHIPSHPVHPVLPVPSELIVPLPSSTEKIIITCTKDLSKEELELLKDYGKVILFDSKVYANVPIESLDFAYMILDIRKREDRYYFQQIGPTFLQQAHVVSVCHSFEKFEDFHEELGVENIINKLPEKQAFKADFDRVLLQKKISKPRPAYSCIKSLFRVVKGDWK